MSAIYESMVSVRSFRFYIATSGNNRYRPRCSQSDFRASELQIAVMAVRVAAVVGSLVLNSFADLYYVQFRPELRAYQKASGGGNHIAMRNGSPSKVASPTAKAFRSMFASSSIKHTSLSPEVFASFLSRAIYFWVWR